MSAILEIQSLHANVGDKQILRGVNLTIGAGEVHAIMGPNGSGKSTLSNVILGHPKYTITSGDILFRGESILKLSTDERARLGLFLSFQYPTALPGVTIGNFLKSILKAHRGKDVPVKEFKQELKTAMDLLEVPQSFIGRYVNDGFSGGEKKRAEILQMNLLKPVLSILDETDSGLDIDALRIVSEGINANRNPERSILLITHYQRMLNYIVPDFVHVFADGRILETGGKDLSLKLEEVGYDWILEREGVK
ncbi:Fe-S cluster assembly ATPase SufC [Leptospira biflexa]|uniref:ABC-type transport system associated with Fe-S cluster assembly, ATPase n=1 Tax=Leptospira biflexa serovar Patoc (strain Patoc 1 / ATCC 23582 / Paris) TaxID=456481 RepID=B0SSD3_LEPBP|nr:Fe-S cluster assembly ATPase SufC [Leptospira biflexa]ABZ94371.1 ATP-binding component of an ABC transporter complex, Fe-S cluster assembly [Leptospira biflexa serovar Patoc strain 'Patoc 1 (Ames)']ABZ98023.1 ABC-type transport system associated with Fe-S cluster assembly, ATPase [Leptospira biflexa serovar Patoc strain 'Patoc 1 (Paris)']TGM36705.1 Fe-S cluster assembly ATPase SufC [Leptospira biflexa]TGM39689.1 Fe-S cluster assembly ATPase SufC [Leptospira biflexa]TGM45154.1 Fe-S cluster a